MALNLSKESRIVKFAEWYERRYGRSAHGHMTVTKAMKEFIVKDWGVRYVVCPSLSNSNQ